MNVKSISLALASLAVVTTAGANAQSIYANVGQCNVVTMPAVVAPAALQWPEIQNRVGTSCMLSYPRSYKGACCANRCSVAPPIGFYVAPGCGLY